LRRIEEEKAVHPVQGKAQQKRTSVKKPRIRAEVYCGKGVPEEAQLLELGWITKEVVVLYLVCKRCEERRCHVEDNRGQGVIFSKKQKALNWCRCIGNVRVAGLQAGIKSTALCSAFDKENSTELDLLHYIYNYYHSYASCFL